ncbi:excinuclease ABC subunit UvrC [Candidatus Gracilibacteria bacterium]|nr:excinuclease ABC subunit UvrC [Candidatus Gracilibacteria bacterium]
MKDLISLIPNEPGIYKMLDDQGVIIYIGKAKNLHKRVSSYFRKDYEHSSRTKKMLEHVKDLQWIQTDSELEALILENNLIKDHQPRYNILMKDDKSYAYIKVQTDEDFPRISVVRERTLEAEGLQKTGARYFGPKLAANKVYETLKLLKKLFPYRHCKLDIAWNGEKGSGEQLMASPKPELVNVTHRVIDFPCLDYYIKRCPGPCIGAVTPEQYGATIKKVLDFLSGKSDTLEAELEKDMMEAAAAKLFEKAARLRDKLFSIRSILQHQKISQPLRKDTDVVHVTTEMGHVYYSLLMIRNGKLVDQEQFAFDALEMNSEANTVDLAEAFESFLVQYYQRAADFPKEILLPWELEGQEAIETWLSNTKGEKVSITIPQRGEKNELLELALKNAVSFAKQHRIKWLMKQKNDNSVTRLKEVISMQDKNIKRIEGFDISHLGGNETVASMVVFENGLPKSSDYRHFKLRTVQGKPDDYKSMEEVLTRRLKYLSKKASIKTTFTKCGKKDFPIIVETIEKEHLNDKDVKQEELVVAKQNKKMVGFGRMIFPDPKTPIITSLYILPEARGNQLGYELIRKIIARHKVKKVYVEPGEKAVDYYAVFGFVPVHDSNRMLYQVKKVKIDASFSARPDLILIDGGKGQLGVVVEVLKKLNLDIPVISLAKRLEEIFIPNAPAPVLLEDGDEARRLLQHIRDESHRFAITFQRELHRKALIYS